MPQTARYVGMWEDIWQKNLCTQVCWAGDLYKDPTERKLPHKGFWSTAGPVRGCVALCDIAVLCQTGTHIKRQTIAIRKCPDCLLSRGKSYGRTLHRRPIKIITIIENAWVQDMVANPHTYRHV